MYPQVSIPGLSRRFFFIAVALLAGCASQGEIRSISDSKPVAGWRYDGEDYVETAFARDTKIGQLCSSIVTLDGKPFVSLREGQSSQRLKLRPGRYRIEVKNESVHCASGADVAPQEVELKPYSTGLITIVREPLNGRILPSLRLNFQARKANTTVEFVSIPPGAEIFVEGVGAVGTTPIPRTDKALRLVWPLDTGRPYRLSSEARWLGGRETKNSTMEVRAGEIYTVTFTAPDDSEAAFQHRITKLGFSEKSKAICERRVVRREEQSENSCILRLQQEENLRIARDTAEGRSCLDKGISLGSTAFSNCLISERNRLAREEQNRQQERADQDLIASDAHVKECAQMGFSLRTEAMAQCRLQLRQYALQHEQYRQQQREFNMRMAEYERQKNLAEADALFGIANQALGIASGRGGGYQAPSSPRMAPPAPSAPLLITTPSSGPVSCRYVGASLVCR